MIKKVLLTIILATLLVGEANASVYENMPSINEAIEQQDAAHDLAQAARVLGYEEDSYIIQTATAHWWDAQTVIDWHASAETACRNFFLVQMKLNEAAVAGILANIYAESTFDWTHDGTMGYGLVQWCGDRQTAARAFAQSYDSELAGQLLYIQHELETAYLDVLLALRGVENSAAGAYQAAYAFCVGYERPYDTIGQAQYRGGLAMEMWG